MGRHGRGKHNEACVWCGNKRTKQYKGRPVCKQCRMILQAGLEPRR